MKIPTSLTTQLAAAAHYLDQPGVINQIHQGVKWVGIPGVVAAKVLYDVAKAPEGKQGDVFVQDASILAPSVAATYLGLATISEKSEALPTLTPELIQEIPALKNNPALVKQLNKFREAHHEGHGHGAGCAHPHPNPHDAPMKAHTPSEMKKLVSQIVAKSPKDKQAEHLARLFFRAGHDHNLTKILMVGGGIVLAGMSGGLLHDALTQNPDDKAKRNKVKEAIFQFVANIALCVTGGSLGEKFADWRKWSPKADDFTDAARTLRWKRTAAMGLGLAAGITAGGWVANWLGKTVVNPFFDWVDNRKDGFSLMSAYKQQRNGDTRKIEPLDLALHLDDIPTMVAIAGVSALLPLIPMFYLVSAWRAGMGYRSCHETPTRSCGTSKPPVSIPAAQYQQLAMPQTFAFPQPMASSAWGLPPYSQYY